jgi:GNAT superfamily N-acetyltransferase
MEKPPVQIPEPRDRFTFRPLTAETLPDLERLFGPRGACGGCWCQWWHRKAADYSRNKGEGNHALLIEQVGRGQPRGVIAWLGEAAVGWCAVAPREHLVRLETSRILKPLDGEGVWAVSCFFIRKDLRGQGLSAALLEAAVRWAAGQGAKTIEGYPIDPQDQVTRAADTFVFTGLASVFRKAGFHEIARRSPTRPVMRLELNQPAP